MTSSKADGSNPAAGDLYVISAPSGAGKTSLVAALVAAETGLVVSTSHTTRPPRDGETDGTDYYFVDEDQFTMMLEADAFLEHARVFDHRYGTARQTVARRLGAGDDVILEIDWQGARQVHERLPDSIGIFVLPPSLEALAERLAGRGQDSAKVIHRRMRAAVDEMSHYDEFDYLIVNDDFEEALANLRCIVQARRLRRPRQTSQHLDLIKTLLA